MMLRLRSTFPHAWMPLVVFAALAPASAAAQCPGAVVQLDRTGEAPYPVGTATYDSTASFNVGEFAHVAFDRDASSLAMDTQAGGRMNARLRLLETFDVTGVPPGTPVNTTLQLSLDGWVEEHCGGSGCGVILESRLVAGPDSVADASSIPGPGGSRENVVNTLSLPVTIVAGSPLPVQFALWFGCGPGQTDASSHMAAHYSLAGLPPGVQAVSCTGAQVTPARASSWGDLKVRYR